MVFTLPHELNPLIIVTRSFCTGFFTDAVPKHFLNYLTIRSISVRHPASSRCSIHGTRRSATMCICTVLFLVAASHMTRRYAGQKTSFLFLSGYSGINLKGNNLSQLDSMYRKGQIVLSSSCETLRNSYEWKEFKNNLYGKDWCPYIKETFQRIWQCARIPWTVYP